MNEVRSEQFRDCPLPLNRAEIPHAAAMLSRAFQNDTLLTQYFPDTARRERAGQLLFTFLLSTALNAGRVITSSVRTEGVAVWLPPSAYPVSWWTSFRSVPLGTAVRFGLAGGARMARLGTFLDTVHSRIAPPDHWYLQLLGVQPESQGRGVAGRLLRTGLSYVDADVRPCYLETTNGRNVPMYEHFGFALRECGRVPGTRIDYWSMVRLPRPAAGTHNSAP